MYVIADGASKIGIGSGLQKPVELPNTQQSNLEPSKHIFAIILEKIGLNIIYSVTFVQKICVNALIYHSIFKNCFKQVQKSQNSLFFAKPSY